MPLYIYICIQVCTSFNDRCDDVQPEAFLKFPSPPEHGDFGGELTQCPSFNLRAPDPGGWLKTELFMKMACRVDTACVQIFYMHLYIYIYIYTHDII